MGPVFLGASHDQATDSPLGAVIVTNLAEQVDKGAAIVDTDDSFDPFVMGDRHENAVGPTPVLDLQLLPPVGFAGVETEQLVLVGDKGDQGTHRARLRASRSRPAQALSFLRSEAVLGAGVGVSGSGGMSKRLFSLRTTSGVTRN